MAPKNVAPVAPSVRLELRRARARPMKLGFGVSGVRRKIRWKKKTRTEIETERVRTDSLPTSALDICSDLKVPRELDIVPENIFINGWRHFLVPETHRAEGEIAKSVNTDLLLSLVSAHWLNLYYVQTLWLPKLKYFRKNIFTWEKLIQ